MHGQYAPEPTIAELVRDVVQDSIARERADAREGLSELPFRERMRARRTVRPQSSLAIASGHPYRRSAAARPVVHSKPKPIIAPVRPAPVRVRAPESAPKPTPISGPIVFAPEPEVAPQAQVAAPAGEQSGGGMTDTSQFAFAAIAVLGLAGLSYMAADNALNAPTEPDFDPLGPDEIFAGDASALALATASEPVGEAAVEMATVLEDPVLPQLWESAFDFARLAADLEVHRAEYELALAEAAERASQVRLMAEADAAAAIAEAEAARIAEEQRQIAEAEIARIAAEEAEKARLAEAEAARVAEEEALRLAQLEAERQAAEEAEARRVARVEAERLARAEAEAERLAQEKATRLAALEAARKQQAQSQDIFLGAATVAPPNQADAPTILFVPHEGSVPQVASLKPSKPPQIKAMAKATAPVTRTAPPVLKAAAPAVRPLAQPQPAAQSGPRKADAFLASRVTRTAIAPIAPLALNGFKQDFLDFVVHGADGGERMIATPDGRSVSVQIEQTVTRQTHKASVRPLEYTQAAGSGTLVVSGLKPEQVSMTCRDVAYSFAGQERGRFAACLAPSGEWVLSRATDRKAIQVAALGEPLAAGLR